MADLRRDDPIHILTGIGPTRATQFADLGISTLWDLLTYAPFRYESVEEKATIASLQADTTVCLHAAVVSKIPIQTGRFRSMIKVRISDSTGVLDITWFNTPFILTSLKVGQSYYFSGKVSLFKGKYTLTNPTVEQGVPQFGSLVPVYHESEVVTSRLIRKLILDTLDRCDLDDDLAKLPLYQKHHLVGLQSALTFLHHPQSMEEVKVAKKRLAFDELFGLIQDVLARKLEHEQSRSIAKFLVTNDDIEQFCRWLPYAPTPSQLEALHAISLDLVQPHPMQRLIQGEVGSGKTTVAAFALWIAARNKGPAMIVCPTKILATQHFSTLQQIIKNSNLTIGLYTGKEKTTAADIYVGTHALLNNVKLHPTLVIIDEEHRFGVAQREAFFQRKKKPHFLSMTATPIPRTVALTALADRDVSFIVPHKSSDNIKTWVVPVGKRQGAYTWIAKTLKETTGQAFIICPFIEESFIETLSTVKSAKKEFQSLKSVFPSFRLELLHGQLKDEGKDKVFQTMMAGKADILVTTPVVEVGVDIPKANIIVIEGAERFGLAQLHQLRGRVGRRGQEAFCLLFTSNETDGTKRLEHFASTYDGNALAEYDLAHRGSGELLGIRQHGFDTLRFANWSDTELIETCKTEVEVFIASQHHS